MVACVLIPDFSLRARCDGELDEAAGRWEGLLGRLEGIGAEVESERAGEAFFAVDGLRGIHGGEVGGVLAAAREAAGMPARIAAAPNRFAAFAAAGLGPPQPGEPAAGPGPRSALVVAGGEPVVPPAALRRFLAPLPVATLAPRLGAGEAEAGELLAALKRLGLGTLGRLAALSPGQVADRFGPLGLRALRLARGEDEPLRPRRPREELAAGIELPEGIAGARLDRALALLVDRLLADPRRRGRTLLALRLSALLAGGGSWSVEQGLARPTASARTIGALLAPRLEALPEPASALALRAPALGPLAGEQLELALAGRERRRRLAAAVREVRAAAGAEALLRVVDADPRSRVPERRAFLTPHPEP
jgi:protein ImuB